ncbi:kinesin-8, putative [Plasmodium knowlesi strain H]|uniref:Kinesin-like protein KIN-8B n=3 Tax=Plasmodium knowlesi TaxID=5850 RepID=A0A5K1UN79_PLAKH|nr:kinesin-8B, putative [Plasmodium knowlesi strain H]OTN66317.1 putative Kinesin [Plasmodium knowlesi]CAA9986290.1 kinesin-8B, putative [Plasmodium knowlesi strain H]SBO25513.1 kinesin-8, putative [Plasmodium knowlesi strain H]SBO28275.1 kinesin-8, putative [Plasmodium knowlesi strain H]VVS75764.1 kinesin-8B, putative [Plasmodium knowlesi strain H]|eukprot:XP_002257695.1 kinesin, putative [Plasmodium knowlesi strain H]
MNNGEHEKRSDSMDEYKWVQAEMGETSSTAKNICFASSSKEAQEDVCISNRTTENDNDKEELPGEYFSSSDGSARECYGGADERGSDPMVCSPNGQDNLALSNNLAAPHFSSYSDPTLDRPPHGEQKNSGVVKICISSASGMGGESFPNGPEGEGSPQCYDEKMLSPVYKGEGNHTTNQHTRECSANDAKMNAVNELMRNIRQFNHSMQSISSTSDTLFQQNLSKMYSELASTKNLESLSGFYEELPPSGPISKEVQQKQMHDLPTGKEADTAVNIYQNIYNDCKNQTSCADERERQDTLNDMEEQWKEQREKDTPGNKYSMGEISPLHLSKKDSNGISSNQWEQMKRSFCDIENNLMHLSRATMGPTVMGSAMMDTIRLEADGAYRAFTGGVSSPTTPNLSYETIDMEKWNSSNEFFPTMDYTVVQSRHINLDIAGSPKEVPLSIASPKVIPPSVASPKAAPLRVPSPRAKLTKLNLGKANNLQGHLFAKEEEDPVKMEPVKMEPVKMEPVKMEPVKVEPVKVDPVKVEFSKSQSTMPKIKSPRNVARGTSNKTIVSAPKIVKLKSKAPNETAKTPKMMKRNSDGCGSAGGVKPEGKATTTPTSAVISTNTSSVTSANHGAVSNVSHPNAGSPTHQTIPTCATKQTNKNEKGGSTEKDVTYNMNVVIRCRPMSASEKNEGAKNVIKILDNKMIVLLDPSDNSDNVLRQNRSREKKYVFDYVFDETSSQEDVYKNSVKCLIDAVIAGYNSTVFAYGATGAGKTHTIIGHKNEPGIMNMILRDLFDRIKKMEVMNEYKVKCSFIEIYNENICDLLNPSDEYLDVREDPIKGVTVSNIFEVCTTSVEEIMELIHTGNKNRTQEPTDANKTSSRSHGVLQVIVEETEKGQGIYQQTKRGKLCVIDLAGSERASQTNNKGMRLLEGANINRSLLALGNVINALVSRSKGTSKSNFIPFRDSKLTRLLKDSLGGNCKTVMIANVSPSHLSYEDTHNTLKYANRAKNIKNVVTSNVVVVKQHLTMYIDVIEKLKSEIEFLKEQLHEKGKMNDYISSTSTNFDYYDQLKEYERNCSREELLNIISTLKRENQRLRMGEGVDATDVTGATDAIDVTDVIDATDAADVADMRGADDPVGNAGQMHLHHDEEITKHQQELSDLRAVNEKLFVDNKRFHEKLQEYMQISHNLRVLNEEYKRQIDGFKAMMHNSDANHVEIKKKLDDLRKKYEQLKENTEDKENDDVFDKWKKELTKVLDERKKIKSVILSVERRLITNKEVGAGTFSEAELRGLYQKKSKMDEELQRNILQTNELLKELPLQIKDEKTKNFLFLFYTNKVLLQEKEELQEFFELSSTIISQKEKQISSLKDQLKMTDACPPLKM